MIALRIVLLDNIDYGVKNNKEFRFGLFVIDGFSKYKFGIPIKIRTAQRITNEFCEIIRESNRQPSIIDFDDGKEFVNKIFTELLNSIGFKKYSRYTKKAVPLRAFLEQYVIYLKSQFPKKETQIGLINCQKCLEDLIRTSTLKQE